MNRLAKTMATVVAATALTAPAFAQSAKEVRGATPFIPVGQEPPAHPTLSCAVRHGDLHHV